MSITVLFMQMIKLFLLMCIGYILYKTDIIDNHTRKKVTKFVLYVTTPALIIHSFIENMGNVDKKTLGILFVIATVFYAVLAVLSVIIVLVLRVKKHEQGIYMFMTVFANVGFMGFPVVESVYGTQGVFYAAIFNCMFNLLLYTLGVFQINYGQEDSMKLADVINIRKLINPGVLCCFIAVVVFLLKIEVHPVINDVLDSVGGLTSTLAMILVGANLATMRLKEVFMDARVYVYTIIKQLAIPFIFWPVIDMAVNDKMIAAVTLILLAMPVANSAVLFATEYQRDEKLAGRAVFITTVASIATIPFVVAVCL